MIDEKTIKNLSAFARLPIEEVRPHVPALEKMLDWFKQLDEVDVQGVEAWQPDKGTAHKRADIVTDGGDAARVLANALQTEGGFFLVPKVVE